MSDQLPWSDTYVSGRSRPSRSRGRSPPLNKTACRVVVSDKVSWSDTPTFHNTLVVGSSPTSSTTQSRATGEFLPCGNARRCADREGAAAASRYGRGASTDRHRNRAGTVVVDTL